MFLIRIQNKITHSGELVPIAEGLAISSHNVGSMGMVVIPHLVVRKLFAPTSNSIHHNISKQFPISPSLQNVRISHNIQVQPDGTALVIQQLVNATRVSQSAFEKTVENLNEIAEATKMKKLQM